MKKVFCDLCGKEIASEINKVAFGITSGSDDYKRNTAMDDIQEDMDFCNECISKVATAIRMLVAPAQLEKPEEDPVPVEDPKPVQPKPKEVKEKKPRKKVDAGRIWALHDAGWNASSIAMELACSAWTVYDILKKPRPEMETAYVKA